MFSKRASYKFLFVLFALNLIPNIIQAFSKGGVMATTNALGSILICVFLIYLIKSEKGMKP